MSARQSGPGNRKKAPAIALLTDFGSADGYVASMKGVLLSMAPGVPLVDITHDIAPQNVDGAAYLLWNVYRTFPPRTVFVAVVDPGVGTARRILCVEAAGYRFLAPDNGLLKFIIGENPRGRVVAGTNRSLMPGRISRTFHGRDVFAPLAAHLARGGRVESLGPRVRPRFGGEEFLELRSAAGGGAVGRVLHIDRFGNIVTNFRVGRGGVKALRVRIGRKVIRHTAATYGDAPAGKPFALCGSSRLLEISIRDGSAAGFLGARRQEPVRISRAGR